MDELLDGLSSNSTTPAPPPRTAKKKKTPRKQQRQKDRPTAATEKTAELKQTMTRYTEFLTDQATAAVANPVTTDVEQTQFEILREIRTLVGFQTKLFDQLEDMKGEQKKRLAYVRQYTKEMSEYIRESMKEMGEQLGKVVDNMYILQDSQLILGKRILSDDDDDEVC